MVWRGWGGQVTGAVRGPVEGRWQAAEEAWRQAVEEAQLAFMALSVTLVGHWPTQAGLMAMGWDLSRDDGDFPDLYRAAAGFAEVGASFHGDLPAARAAASHAVYRREVGARWHNMLLRIGRTSWDADAALGLARVREPGRGLIRGPRGAPKTALATPRPSRWQRRCRPRMARGAGSGRTRPVLSPGSWPACVGPCGLSRGPS